MKRILHLIFALFILCLLPSGSSAQFTDYERDTKWNIGLNMGGVWQDGDIRLDRPGFGYGFTIGKGIYEAPNKFWNVDLRFRYLKGFTYGLNTFRTDSTELDDNTVLSTNPTNYKNSLGYTYLNSKTMIHDFSLEAVVNFHRLRERTGIIFSVFGGIGFTDYRTWTNLENNADFGKIYNYDLLDPNTLTRTELRGFLDNDKLGIGENAYENHAPFNEDVTLKFMPSLGVGLGYQFTKQWSVGFEHRVTFALQDEFDGQIKEGTQFLQWGDNDKYHYSSVYLRLNIFRGKESTTTSSRDCPPPYLQIADYPERYEVNEAQFSVRARVSKIKTNNDVILVVNEQIQQTAYNASTDYISSTINLIEGENKVYFIATNVCGESMDSMIVVYNPDFCPKPVLSFLEPTSDSVTSKELAIKAQVLRLQGGSLRVSHNNKTISHQFDSVSNILSATTTLSLGQNIVSINGTNKCGDTTITKTLTYYCEDPTVTISSPENGKLVKAANINLSAVTTNINSKDQVSVLLNGQAVVFDFIANKVSGNLNAIEGANVLSITVTNDCGTDTKTVSFNYEKPCLLPQATISAPQNNANLANPTVNFRGAITNVANANSVVVRLNGAIVNSNFTASSGSVSATLNLRQGANTIELTGTNICGTDTKTVTVNYNCPAPLIAINRPANGISVSTPSVVVSGTVTNITASNQINLLVNGMTIPVRLVGNNFTATVNLRQGQNNIAVSATTNCGTDSRSLMIAYNAPCPPPAIVISSPANGSSVSTQSVMISGVVSNITSSNQVNLLVNGVSTAVSVSGGNFSARVNLRDGQNTINASVSTQCGNDNKTIIVNFNKPCPQPFVTITSPVNGTTVNASSVTLSGSAMNINSQSDMSVRLNGATQSFSWNATTKAYVAALNLQPGNNSISVTANTNCGNDTKTTTVIYNKVCPKPTATITSPRNGLNATSLSVPFTGVVTNIQNASQVVLKLNGTPITKSFNATTGVITATLSITNGGNTVELIATNSCGSATANSAVSFKCPLPTVNIASPNNGMSYTNSSLSFNGFVSGVSNQNQVSVKLNGTTIPFTYDTRLSKFSGTVTLIEGSNTIEASVTNQCGTVNTTRTITYTKPCPKPTVMFTSPSNGITSSIGTVQVTGRAINIINQSDLQLQVNGAPVNFTYNSVTKVFSATVTLTEGSNSISASVATNCGNDSKTLNVTYNKPCPKPTVSILNPANGANPTDQFIRINGGSTNVTSKSQMTVKMNGVSIPFSFNPSSGAWTSEYDLSQGNNVITVTVTTPCGTQTKTVTIGWSAPCPKPVVTVSTPTNGKSLTTASTSVSGSVTNVSTKSELRVNVNGTDVPFTFNSGSKTFSANVTLREGANTISVIATTTCGNNVKNVQVSYKKPCASPSVSLSSPSNKSTVSTQGIVVSGIANNLKSSSEITVKLNGSNIPVNYNSVSKKYTANASLRNGSNAIVVTVKNECGEATKSASVVYSPPCPKPTISILAPRNNSTVSATTITISGVVTNIQNKSDMQLRVNGKSVAFTYNASTKSYSARVTLSPGTTNTITADVATNCGNDSKTSRVISKVKIIPTIQIGNPADSSTVVGNQLKIFGTVQKVTAKSQFTITVNGKRYTGFVFKGISNENFSFNGLVTLKPGANIIVFRAVSPSGGVKVITRTVFLQTSVKAPNNIINQGSGEATPKKNTGTASPSRPTRTPRSPR